MAAPKMGVDRQAEDTVRWMLKRLKCTVEHKEGRRISNPPEEKSIRRVLPRDRTPFTSKQFEGA